MHGPRLFSIAPGAAFLPTLVKALKEGKLIEGFDAADPMALARATIYVPTRRAARTLRSILVEMSATQASFLPDIRPLGDVDDDTSFFITQAQDVFSDNPPISSIERLLLLARLIRPWRESLPDHLRALFGTENIAIPANTADAIWLAGDLARLMDQVETEEADWSQLQEICPDLVAEWWQVTLDFLQIITAGWPQILAERQLSNPAYWRNQAIRAHAKGLQQNPPSGPVIAAGSTGSIPATAELIKVIAHLPQGAVVLPGLDRDLDEAGWQALSNPEIDPSVFGHPQYGLKHLIETTGAIRDMVTFIGEVAPQKRQREYLVAQAFRPAATTDAWANLDESAAGDAFSNVALIETASEREEATVIATVLRTAIEPEQQTAAFVTGDRNLARRVAGELKRFGIYADDSGGRPLAETEPATLLRLLLDCIFSPGDPVAFLSLLKHPLTRLSQNRGELRRQVERFELFALRGGTGRISLSQCPAFIAERLLKLTDLDDTAFEKIEPAVIEEAQQFGAILMETARPLALFAEREDDVTMAEAVTATVESFEGFGRDENGSLKELYSREAGQGLMQFLRDLLADNSGLTFKTHEWPEILAALMAGQSVRTLPGGHPRLYIWGALEARLQTVDTLVIGALNEGIWPSTTRNDPFMSRPMKATVALEPPERRIGLAAHDFQMALGMDKVILTRSIRQENAPSVPSRWLQRLETVLGQEETDALRARGAHYLDWARSLDRAPDEPFTDRPCPKPPLAFRPDRFSVTEIETLRRDPYAIYAKKILRLKPLEPLIRDPSVAERGTLYHAIVAAFADSAVNPAAADAYQTLTILARAEFDKMQLPIDVEAIWWPRFKLLIPEILDWEKGLGKRQRFAEATALPVLINKTGISLSGRADRIDILADGSAEILDFKTGSTPSVKQAATLMAPQLALEGALLTRGAFGDIGSPALSDLLYIRLTGKGEVEPQSILRSIDKSAAGLSEEAWVRLDELVSAYLDPGQGYLSRAMPPVVDYEGDYDHLARIREWSAGSGGEDE